MNKDINNENPIRNAEGYLDLTAHDGIERATFDVETHRHTKLLKAIYSICDLAGYHVQGRIVLKDKFTGKVWE